MKNKIIVILNRLVVGGQTLDTLPLLQKLSDEFEILVLHGRKEADEKDASGLLNKYGLKGRYIASLRRSINLFTDAIAFYKVYKIIKKYRPQIVHTHGSKSGMIGRLAAYKAGVPVILHTFHGHLFHSYYNHFFTFLLKYIERSLGRITTTAIAISDWQKKELSQVYKILPADKLQVIHLGVEPNKTLDPQNIQRLSFRKKYNIPDDTVVISLIGRIVPIKHVDMFVKVAKSLLDNTKIPICFFIIGDGYLKKKIQQQCSIVNLNWVESEQIKAGTSVIFTSWIENILPAVHGIDILALTSHNEGTPMSIIEAQYCGKPVVATNVGGVRNTLVDKETGYLIEPGNVTEMVIKLKLLAENSALRIEMGSKAAKFAATNFSKDKEIEQFRILYNKSD